MIYIFMFIAAVFVNNIVLSQFLGICPFLGVSKKVNTAVGMSGAVAFVLTLATIITWLVYTFLLDPFNLGYLQTISFILVIASLVQLVEIVLKKISPALYQSLGVFLPLISTNCCILGVAILVIQKDYNLQYLPPSVSVWLWYCLPVSANNWLCCACLRVCKVCLSLSCRPVCWLWLSWASQVS